MKLSTQTIALTAIFASLYYVLSLITPHVPAIGIPEIVISLEALIASVFGLVLGPYLGALAAFTGASITWIISGMSPHGLPFLLSPPLNALTVGLLYYRKWKLAFATLGLLILVFVFLPPSQPLWENSNVAVAVLWDKVIALLLIFPSVKFAKHLSSTEKLPILYFLLAFIGNQTDNMWGSDIFAVPIVYEGIFGAPLDFVRSAFLVSPFVYPAIRLMQALFATIIAVPLMAALKNTGWAFSEKTILSP
ncbi:MAG: ECF transporter S component [Candidatus Bathyarchaeota archaeon]|nr:MAG: ECF transporter S component [Candidatus Bathyarchaeota archaeon]